VNSVFEDQSRKDSDPDANTSAFLIVVPDYIAHGVRCFTICLQGGYPGYEGAINSAFDSDGSLREEYLNRVRRVITTCDAHGAAVILGCYYQRQDQVLKDEEAVRKGIINVVKWLKSEGFTNVLLEVANEHTHAGFDHRIIQTPEGMAELIRLAQKTNPRLLVSASGLGNGKIDEPVAEAADFILIHFNSTPVEQIPERINAVRKYGKAIVCNEDDKSEEESIRALVTCVENGISWGLMLNDLNQYAPFEFHGHADAPRLYERMRQIISRVDQ